MTPTTPTQGSDMSNEPLEETPSENDWIWSQDEDDGKGGWIYEPAELGTSMTMFKDGNSYEYVIVFNKPTFQRWDYSVDCSLSEARDVAEALYWRHVSNPA